MGSFLSSPTGKAPIREHLEVSCAESYKRFRMSPSCYSDSLLFPSLPNEVSLQILARVPRIDYLNLKLVSKSWKVAVTGHEIYQLRKELGTTEEWLYILVRVDKYKLMSYALDPSSGRWQRLPQMPESSIGDESKRHGSGSMIWNMMDSGIKITDVIRGWLGWKHVPDKTPFYGCSIGCVDGCLFVLGGFLNAFSLNHVWRYDPRLNSWKEVNPMNTRRAYCKTAVLNEKLYVVGGVYFGRGGVTPLRSAEVYNPRQGVWTDLPDIPFSKAGGLPTAFLADALKPIATGMAAYGGKLCVPQSLYTWPFYVDMGGEMYDPETNSWVEMPAGMGDGWPAKQAGLKLGVVVEGELYTLDPDSTLDSGTAKMYDAKEDTWKVVAENVPLHGFTESEVPFLLASFLGRLNVVTKDANNDIVILQADPWMHNRSSPSKNSSSQSVLSPAAAEKGTGLWKTIARKNFGSAELVGCQVQVS